ncbi:hypothetical protein VCUG_02419 [Vavraia culicis subsp. floridensis]|uniref:GPN-loop GTPase 3 n=1 Tax=Vavraia culicis (isolate floridensis) TaxID=948595 RepID=L2GR34_VAVCU|nr:uncharacterized protein VCUG_02419 [Vavraia culicis subsp. floridensis]ELA46084.1 hypothetical protein VCUG_02419 [Vavraia culicis subsp. floridensis]
MACNHELYLAPQVLLKARLPPQFQLHEQVNYFIPMIYGELIIGLPGSGKTTYVKYKKEYLAGRNVYTVNLDPGRWERDLRNDGDAAEPGQGDRNGLQYGCETKCNSVPLDLPPPQKNCAGERSEEKSAETRTDRFKFDFDITQKYDTRKYMKQREVGPNLAVKRIMEEFVEDYENLRNIFCDEDRYYLVDTPGQIESVFVLDKLLLRLQRDGIRLVTVFLSDINSMASIESLSYTYFVTMQTMVTLNNSQVNVFTKLDLLGSIRLIGRLSNLVELNLRVGEYPLLFRVLYSFIERESLIEYQVLEYSEDVLGYLQFCIDQASGFVNEIEDENALTEYLNGIKEKEDILRAYEEKEEQFEEKEEQFKRSARS